MAGGLLVRASGLAGEIGHIGMTLGGEFFAIPVVQVQEIQNYEISTPIPRAPSWLKGVINLRGDIVSVVDISSFLGLPPVRLDRKTKLIVVEGERYNTAILADAVLDVLAIMPNELRDLGALTGRVERTFIRGAYLAKENLYAIIDVQRLLASDQMLQYQ
jgi:purine-binding chemotaxis protein CheW